MTAPTYRIDVDVQTAYLPEQSEPEEERFVFAYTVTLHNSGSIGAQLLTRHWLITDGNGQEQEVRGDGVVGEQPLLAPGESYEYTSGTVLDTPIGTMQGSYQMVAEDGYRFDAEIPLFSLVTPHVLH